MYVSPILPLSTGGSTGVLGSTVLDLFVSRMILASVPKSAIFGYHNPIMATNFYYVTIGKPKGYMF